MVKNNVYLTNGEKVIIQVGIAFVYEYMDQNPNFKTFLKEKGYGNSVTRKKIKALLKKIPID